MRRDNSFPRKDQWGLRMTNNAFGTRLLLLLTSSGLITSEQASEATENNPTTPEQYLLGKGLVTRRQLSLVAARSFGNEAVKEDARYLPGLLSEEVQRKFQLFPVGDGERVSLAACSPGTDKCTAELESVLGKPVEYVITDRISLKEHFDQLSRPQPPSMTVPAPVAISPVEAPENLAKLAQTPAPGSAEDTPSPPPPEEAQSTRQAPLQSAQDPEPPVEKAPEPARPAPPVGEPTMAVAVPQLRPSELLIGGRYRRAGKILDGRFSTLYKGKDERTGLPVSIRHLESYSHINAAAGQPTDEARAQTLREGRLLSKLVHPSLPRVRQLVQDGYDVYLVGDALPQHNLKAEVSENGAYEPELVRRYLIQLLRVVNYLHSQEHPIIHRDLRAETILASEHGSLCLAEFGLAKIEESSSVKATTSFRSAGDPHFAAPEQLMGDTSSVKNDLYSVGALAYFLATGKPPAESLKRFAGASLMEPLPPELDPKIRDVIVKCLAPKPEDRADSAEELLSTIDLREVRVPTITLAPAPTASPVSPEGETEGVIDDPDATAKLEDANKPPDEETAVGKRSMWQLLFGRKKKQQDTTHSFEENVAVKQKQMESAPFADLASMDLTREMCRVLPEALCRTINGICIGSLSESQITVAVKDPTDVHIYDQINIGTKGQYTATLMRAEPSLIDHAIEYIYRGEHFGPETRWSKFLDLKRLHDVEIETTNEQAVITFGDEALEGPIVEAVDRLIKEAIAADASDIHLEPFDTGMDIRYRIDGVLRKVAHHERQEASAIVKRLKVMANMDIAQERVTQGGRISLKVGTQEFDLRVSIVPVPVGESVVMRILKKGAFTLTLGDLGFSEEKETRFRRILSQPHGMILVCGPTGSGKSTTLYASLKEIQRPDRKLLTAEDPIEYQMPGIIQVQMNTAPKEEEKKVTFSKTLREFLRQDPDVILVGEIRDQETAEIGIQAALTGHLLLSTLHTNDSIGIIARLRDMDCEPFQIGSVLLGGLAQRLARRICQNCRAQIPVPEEMMYLFEDNGISNPKMYKGRGCRKCHLSGHRGRVGLYELLEITPEIRAHINRGDLEEEIRATAVSQGFKELLLDGLEKVCQGYVTLEEVLRVCKTF